MDSDFDWFIASHKPRSLVSWASSDNGDDTEWRFGFAHIVLQFSSSLDIPTYTHSIANVTVRDHNDGVRRRDLDPIRQDVRAILAICAESVVATRSRLMDTYIIVLLALERIAEFEDPPSPSSGDGSKHTRGWDAAQLRSWEEVIANPYGLDVSTIKDTAHDLLGQTPAELVAGISDEFRIVHMESVVRPDLLARFLEYQRDLADSLTQSKQSLTRCRPPAGSKPVPSRREDVVADMVRPRVSFHGTPLRSVRSIIRHGFLKPGRLVDGKVVSSPRSGVAFDRGIYSSPSPGYALSYAVGHEGQTGQQVRTPLGALPTLRLFVCATIMGRTLSGDAVYADGWDDWKDVHGPLVRGYDSHWDGAFEYIAHDERAMLPCYVLHLDLGTDRAREAVALAQASPFTYQQQVRARRAQRLHPRLAARSLAPGDRKREKQARKAAAMKNLPYGFGSARGTQFVVQEIGRVSDDEEEYGEWQADKHAYVGAGMPEVGDGEEDMYNRLGSDAGRLEKGLFLDGYQNALR